MSNDHYTILIVDDEDFLHQRLKTVFLDILESPYRFVHATSEKELTKILASAKDKPATVSPDLILLDLVLDRDTNEKAGLRLLQDIKRDFPDLPIIVVTKDEDTATVVEAMKNGATDYFNKRRRDFEIWNEKILTLLREKNQRDELIRENKNTLAENLKLKQEVSLLKSGNRQHAFIGESKQIREIKILLDFVAHKPHLTVLITGETGVGKEVAARYLHQVGPRHNQPFVAVNLSALQQSTMEQELFGSLKEAFTDVSMDSEGYFKQANGGILMLDEIGDINHSIQVKLLRFLETHMIRPVGANKDIELNVQVVVATNKNLREEVKKGNFRPDLYQRLKNMVVDIPPLRERREDILPILSHFLQREGFKLEIVTEDAKEKLLSYHWEGNIRELLAVTDKMVLNRTLKGKALIDVDCLPQELLSPGVPMSFHPEEPPTTPNYHQITLSTSAELPNGLNVQAKSAFLLLQEIEKALIIKNKVKQDAAILAGLKGSDHLRYRIKRIYNKYPNFLEQFPVIRESYPHIFKEVN